MINKTSFKKMSKNIFNKSKGIQNPKLMHPEREWAVGIVSALLIFILASSWSVASYFNYRDTTPVEKKEESGIASTYRKTLVESALEEFSSREITHKKLQEGKVIIKQDDTQIKDILDTASTTKDTATSTISIEEGEEELVVPEEDIVKPENTDANESPQLSE